LLAGFNLDAEPFSITNVRVSGDTISLSWNPEPARAILNHSPSLTTGAFEYVGSVLPTNSTSVSNVLGTGFYRIRQVVTIVFPDPCLGSFNRIHAIENGAPFSTHDSRRWREG
jgi:hypothetical protein